MEKRILQGCCTAGQELDTICIVDHNKLLQVDASDSSPNCANFSRASSIWARISGSWSLDLVVRRAGHPQECLCSDVQVEDPRTPEASRWRAVRASPSERPQVVGTTRGASIRFGANLSVGQAFLSGRPACCAVSGGWKWGSQLPFWQESCMHIRTSSVPTLQCHRLRRVRVQRKKCSV